MKRKLNLKRETIRNLGSRELGNAAGGTVGNWASVGGVLCGDTVYHTDTLRGLIDTQANDTLGGR